MAAAILGEQALHLVKDIFGHHLAAHFRQQHVREFLPLFRVRGLVHLHTAFAEDLHGFLVFGAALRAEFFAGGVTDGAELGL